MAKFKIVTPAGASFSVAGVGYKLEMEGLGAPHMRVVHKRREELRRALDDTLKG